MLKKVDGKVKGGRRKMEDGESSKREF